MTTVTDGLGNHHDVTYSPLTDENFFYTANGSDNPPVTRLIRGAAIYVVSEYVTNDGIGGTYTIPYLYWNAKVDMRGRGFLGFEQIRTSDVRQGYTFYTSTSYSQDYPYVGRMTDQSVSESAQEISTKWRDWENLEISSTNDRTAASYHFIRLKNSTDSTFETDGTLIERVNRFVTWNDAHGTIEIDDTQLYNSNWSSSAGGQYHRTITTIPSFDDNLKTNQWCLGRPTQIDIEKQFTDAQPFSQTRSTTLTYHQTDCYLKTQTENSGGVASERRVTTYGMDGSGRPLTINITNGDASVAPRVTTFGYPDTWTARATSETFASPETTDPSVGRTWDESLGLEQTVTDVRGLLNTLSYDAFGRLKKLEQTTLGTYTDLTYALTSGCSAFCPANSQYTITSAGSNGFTSTSHLDRFGRSVGEAFTVIGGESRSAIVYDTLGRIDKENVPYLDDDAAYWIHYDNDEHGRRTAERKPAHNGELGIGTEVTTRIYAGANITVKDALGRDTLYLYQPDGQIHQVTDEDGGVTNNRYTPFSDLYTVTDSDDSAAKLTILYDELGNPASQSDADTGDWTFGYNVFGELVSQADDQTQAMTLIYDQLGRLTQRVEPEGTTTWTYVPSGSNGFGLVDTITGPTDLAINGYTKAHTYNALAQLTQTDTTIDGDAYATNFTYTPQAQLWEMTYPETMTVGSRAKFVYDYSQGHLSTVVQDFGSSTSSIYQVTGMDALGRETGSSSGAGLITSQHIYDAGNTRLTDIKTSLSGTADLQDYGYTWDTVGNLKSRTDRNQGPLTETFNYDNLNRLKDTSLGVQLTQSFTYYPDGRIETKRGANGYRDVGTYVYGNGTDSNAVTGIVESYTSQPVAEYRPNTYHYDGNGNMDCRGDTNSTCTSGDAITWYSFNKPKEIHFSKAQPDDRQTTFVYGPDRRRIKQTSRRLSVLTKIQYVDTHLEQEKIGGTTYYRSYVFANGQSVYSLHEKTWLDGCGNPKFVSDPYFIHRDHQGSVDQMTLDTLTPMPTAYSYDAFGKRRNPTWTPDDLDSQLNVNHVAPRGYTGHEHLDRVRLIHMNGRVQDPILGAMISADPFMGDVSSPQSLNRYSYVMNNPLTFTDPSGFTSCITSDSPTCSVVFSADRFSFEGTNITTTAGEQLIADFNLDRAAYAQDVYFANLSAEGQFQGDFISANAQFRAMVIGTLSSRSRSEPSRAGGVMCDSVADCAQVSEQLGFLRGDLTRDDLRERNEARFAVGLFGVGGPFAESVLASTALLRVGTSVQARIITSSTPRIVTASAAGVRTVRNVAQARALEAMQLALNQGGVGFGSGLSIGVAERVLKGSIEIPGASPTFNAGRRIGNFLALVFPGVSRALAGF
jgi:RHS repeat-associated protein